MKKYNFIFLFLFIIFIIPDCFAQSLDVSSIITSPTGGSSTGGKYTATELNGSRGPFNIGTRYNGTLTKIEFNLPFPSSFGGDCFWTNMKYTVTMNMATQDWRNRFGTVYVNPYSNSTGNYSNGHVTFVSMKKIYFTFTIPSSDTVCRETLYVTLNSNDLFTPFTGETNWNLSSVILSDTYNPSSGGSSGGSSSGGSSSTPTPTPDASNQDIINSQTQNTQDIIDNQNENTSNIIENNNQNTQDIIDNQNENTTCPVGPLFIDYDTFKDDNFVGKALNSDGTYINNSSYAVSVYFKIKPNKEYSFKPITSINDRYLCFYKQDKTVLSCTPMASATFTSPNGSVYMRLSLRKERASYLEGPVCNDWKSEGLDKIANAITNDSIDDKTGFFTGFQNNDHGLSSIITLPLQTIQNLTNNSCVALSVPIPYTNSSVTLPCMKNFYRNYIPDIYDIWQIVSFGIISYLICIDIFKMVKGFKDPNDDKVEVLDL